jgi:hypothetical protein
MRLFNLSYKKKKPTLENPSRQLLVAPLLPKPLSARPPSSPSPNRLSPCGRHRRAAQRKQCRLIIAIVGSYRWKQHVTTSSSPSQADSRWKQQVDASSSTPRWKQRRLVVAIVGGCCRSVSSPSSPSPASSSLPHRSSLPAGGAPCFVDRAHAGEEGTIGMPRHPLSSV